VNEIIARGTVSQVGVDKPDFRVGDFYWLLSGKEYELGMG
jgi:hypothetical protein